MPPIQRSDSCSNRCHSAADAALLDAALRLGRQVASGAAHDLNSALQSLGDALFIIGEDVGAALSGACDDGTVERVRESIRLAGKAHQRTIAASRALSGLIPEMDDESSPVDLRGELDALIAITTHQWKQRLDVSAVVDPAMPVFTCAWWAARLAALQLILIAAELHPRRRVAVSEPLPRFRMIASESEGSVVLRVICDQPPEQAGVSAVGFAGYADPTLRLCAERLGGEVASVPCSLGSFGIAFRFPVRVRAAAVKVARK